MVESLKTRWVYVAFVAWAVLSGIVADYVSNAFVFAVNAQIFAGEAFCDGVAALVLFSLAVTKRQKMPNAREWRAVLVLLLPQWFSVVSGRAPNSSHWLRELGWGAGLLLMVAAPLWLGLLSAMGATGVKVPRAAVGAAIAGVFAVCLVTPVEMYSIGWSQAVTLVVQILLNIAVVASWVYAGPRLVGANTWMVTSAYLFLGSLGDAAFAVMFRSEAWQPLDWGRAWEPLLLNTAFTTCISLLWFWLLKRMTLTAFSMRALAAWTAELVFALLTLGLKDWRVDLALLTGAAAITVGLKARVQDEQPTALGLGDS